MSKQWKRTLFFYSTASVSTQRCTCPWIAMVAAPRTPPNKLLWKRMKVRYKLKVHINALSSAGRCAFAHSWDDASRDGGIKTLFRLRFYACTQKWMLEYRASTELLTGRRRPSSENVLRKGRTMTKFIGCGAAPCLVIFVDWIGIIHNKFIELEFNWRRAESPSSISIHFLQSWTAYEMGW